jgi:5-methylcytosine-specific restriction endonuclease McrA
MQTAWQRANPEKSCAGTMRYYAKKRDQSPPLTVEEQADVLAFYEKARALTALTGVRHEVDHIRPITKGGQHHPSNLQILTATENRQKGNSVYWKGKASRTSR